MLAGPSTAANLLAKITLDAAMDQVYWTDREGKFLYANDSASRHTGYGRDELLRMSVSDLAPDFSPSAWQIHWEELKLAGALTFEARQVNKDGTYRDVEVMSSHVAYNGIEFTTAYVRDITERKQAERHLRESESRFRNLADSAPVLIWLSDKTKQCTYFNKRWLDFTGRTLAEESGNGWTNGVHPDDLGRCLATYEQAFDEREPFTMEYRLRHVSGAYRWIIDNGVPRFSDDDEFLGYVGACTDITERRQAEEDCRKRELEYLTLAQHAPNNIIRYDRDCRILFANANVEKTTGIPFRSLIGQAMPLPSPDDPFYIYRSTLRNVIATGCDASLDVTLPDTGQGERHHHIRFVVERDKRHAVSGVLAIGNDITDRIRTEKTLREDVAKREKVEQSLQAQQIRLNRLANELLLAEERERRRIAAGLHDQIVQSLAMGKILVSEKLNQDLPETCRSVHEQVRDIFATAINGTRTLIFDLSPPLLYELGLAAALEELGERLGRESGFRFELKTCAEEKGLSEMLRVTLYQMVREVLLNVVKHACATMVVLTCEATREGLRFAVNDNGRGFNPTRQTSHCQKSGKGYGLFSIRQRINLLGGSFVIESAPGTGTRLTLVVPINERDAGPAPSGYLT